VNSPSVGEIFHSVSDETDISFSDERKRKRFIPLSSEKSQKGHSNVRNQSFFCPNRQPL